MGGLPCSEVNVTESLVADQHELLLQSRFDG
jgi:hypothetical protein